MFFKLGVLKDLKTPVLESLFDKIAGLQAFIKNRIQHSCFSVKIANFYSEEHLRMTTPDYYPGTYTFRVNLHLIA